MTHGDKTKAKAAKSSKASGKKDAGKTGGNGKSSKKAVTVKAVSESSKAGAGKKATPVKKAAAPPAVRPKERGETKSRAAAADAAAGFSNPAVATAFKHALKKYPNAFRKLTD